MKHLLLVLCMGASALWSASVTQTLLFPADWQGNQFAFVEKYPSTLVFKLAGDGKKMREKPPVPVIELPENLRLLKVSTRVGGTTEIPFKEECVTRNGKKFRRYRIAIPGRLLFSLKPDGFGWKGGFQLYIEPEGKCAGQEADFKIHIEEDGGKSFERSYKGTILPELPVPEKPLEGFSGGVTSFSAGGLSDDSIFRKNAAFWLKLTRKPFVSTGWEKFTYPAANNAFLDANFQTIAGTYATRDTTPKFSGTDMKDLGFMVNGKVTRPGVPLLRDSEGKIRNSAICPQYLLRDPEGVFWGEYFRRGFQTMFRHFPNSRIIWFDYEPFVSFGTCDDCLADFAKFAGLKNAPSREEIKDGKPLNRKWRDYKVIQHRKLLEKFVDSARKHFPEHEIHLCCAPPGEDFANSWDAVDSSTVVGKVAAFNPMNYTVGLPYYDAVAHQEKALGKLKNFSWVDPAEEEERFFIRYAPDTVVQNLVATAALGADGFVVYPTDSLDGKMLHAIGRGFAALGETGEIVGGKNISSRLNVTPMNAVRVELLDDKGVKSVVMQPDFSGTVRSHLHEKGGIYAVSLLNYSGREVFLKVAIPGFKGKGKVIVRDALNNELHTGISADLIRSGFLTRIPADGARIFRIGGSKATGKEVAQKSVEDALNVERKQLDAGAGAFRSLREGEAALNWRAVKGSPMAELSFGKQYLWINPVSAEAFSWKNGTKTPIGGKAPVLGGVRFFDSRNIGGQKYHLDGVTWKPDYAELRFSHIVPSDAGFGTENPLSGMKIEKRFRLHKGDDRNGKLTVFVTFSNPTSKEKQFGFRIFNMPLSGWKNPERPFGFQLDGTPKAAGKFFVRPGMKINWSSAAHTEPHDGKFEGKLSARWYDYMLHSPDAAGFYTWTNGIEHTLEPLFEDVKLAPGKKKEFLQEFSFRLK